MGLSGRNLIMFAECQTSACLLFLTFQLKSITNYLICFVIKFLKGIVGFLILVLIALHFFLLSFFFTPIPKALNVLFDIEKSDFISLSELPDYTLNAFLSDKNYEKNFLMISDDLAAFQRLIASSLKLRSRKFFDDDENRELYLNSMNFGGGVVGLQAASEYYFKKPASDLSQNEAMTLVNLFRMFGN